MSTFLIAHFGNGTTDSRPAVSREEARTMSKIVYKIDFGQPGFFVRIGDEYESFTPAGRDEDQPSMVEVVTR